MRCNLLLVGLIGLTLSTAVEAVEVKGTVDGKPFQGTLEKKNGRVHATFDDGWTGIGKRISQRSWVFDLTQKGAVGARGKILGEEGGEAVKMKLLVTRGPDGTHAVVTRNGKQVGAVSSALETPADEPIDPKKQIELDLAAEGTPLPRFKDFDGALGQPAPKSTRINGYQDVRQGEFGNCWFLSTVAAGAHVGRIDPAYLTSHGYDPQASYAPVSNGANWVNFLAEKFGTNLDRGNQTARAFEMLWGKKPQVTEFSVKNLIKVIRTAKRANERVTVVARNGAAFQPGHAMAVVGYDDSTFPGKLMVYDQALKMTRAIDLGKGTDYGLLDRIYQLP